MAVFLTKGPQGPALLGRSAALLGGSAFVAVFVEDAAVNHRVTPWFVTCAVVVVGAAVVSCVRWVRGDRLRRHVHDGAGERIDRWRAGLSVEYDRAVYRLDELCPDSPGDRRALRADRDEAVAASRRAAGARARDGRSPRDRAPLGVYVLDARVPEAAAARRASAPRGARH